MEDRGLVDEVARYERQLRRRAGARVGDDGGSDAGLTELLTTIGERRARRSGAALGEISTSREEKTSREVKPAAGSAATAPSEPREPARREPGRLLAIEDCGSTVRVFRIGRPAGFEFTAGQYLKAGAPGGKREDFSIASAPHDPDLELAIELREGGTVTPALFGLRVGDTVDLSETAKGKLRLDPSADHHLMVATVTGIAPLRSMLRDAVHRGSGASFTVLLGASYASELPFHDELVALADEHPNVTYVATVSRPDESTNRGWTGATGRVDPLAVSTASGLDPSTTHVYAVGNSGMIDAVRSTLGDAGFAVSTESYGS